MKSTTRAQRSYDHRLRELVRSTADIDHATRRGVPRSTARGWLKSQRSEVVTLDVADKNLVELQRELLDLRCRVERLLAVLRLLIVLLKVSGFSLATARVPREMEKRSCSELSNELEPSSRSELLSACSGCRSPDTTPGNAKVSATWRTLDPVHEPRRNN